MPQTLSELRATLAAAGAAPNRKLGQNFLVDLNLLGCVLDAGELTGDDRVLEVGPGTGSLTEGLLQRLGPGGRLLAVEFDRALHGVVQRRFGDDPRLTLLHADALAELPRVLATLGPGRPAPKLVANLPYQIASPLLVELATSDLGFERLVFTVQREVAERIAATPGDDAYGPLGVILQVFCRVERLRDLPPTAFWPPPKIHSALVRLFPLGVAERAERLGPAWARFPAVVHALLAYRRKTLERTLKLLGESANDGAAPAVAPADLRSALHQAGVDLGRRGETLSVDELAAVVRALPA